VDERKVLIQKVVSDDRTDGRAVACGEITSCLFELARPHVVCRRIDQVARERDALDHAREIITVDAIRISRPHFLLIGIAIAREAVPPSAKPSAASRLSCGSLAKR